MSEKKPAGAPPADMWGNRRPIGGLGMPTQKAKNFKGTLRRLLAYLQPHRAGLAVVILAGAIGTVFQVLGPKILGLATKKIFEGFIAKARGVPGAAIDFDAVGRILLWMVVLWVVDWVVLVSWARPAVASANVPATHRAPTFSVLFMPAPFVWPSNRRPI